MKSLKRLTLTQVLEKKPKNVLILVKINLMNSCRGVAEYLLMVNSEPMAL